MLYISITEFRNNISYYIKLCQTEDLYITKNGKTIAVLSSADKHYYATLERLCGCLQENDTGENYKDMIGNEILKRCGY